MNKFLYVVHFESPDPATTLRKSVEVLQSVDRLPQEAFDDGRAAAAVPTWFAEACSPTPSLEERQRYIEWWRGLTSSERAEADEDAAWTLENWLHWREPEMRSWHWHDAVVAGPDSGVVRVSADGWPAATGALIWLLRASGATRVTLGD